MIENRQEIKILDRPEEFKCDQCIFESGSSKGLNIHRAKKHKIKINTAAKVDKMKLTKVTKLIKLTNSLL